MLMILVIVKIKSSSLLWRKTVHWPEIRLLKRKSKKKCTFVNTGIGEQKLDFFNCYLPSSSFMQLFSDEHVCTCSCNQ